MENTIEDLLGQLSLEMEEIEKEQDLIKQDRKNVKCFEDTLSLLNRDHEVSKRIDILEKKMKLIETSFPH